jgi:hypothetical protein
MRMLLCPIDYGRGQAYAWAYGSSAGRSEVLAERGVQDNWVQGLPATSLAVCRGPERLDGPISICVVPTTFDSRRVNRWGVCAPAPAAARGRVAREVTRVRRDSNRV